MQRIYVYSAVYDNVKTVWPPTLGHQISWDPIWLENNNLRPLWFLEDLTMTTLMRSSVNDTPNGTSVDHSSSNGARNPGK